MFTYKSIVAKSAIGISLAFALSGCGASGPYVPYQVYNPEKSSEIIKKDAKIQNGSIITPDGKQFFDDEGDIQYVHNVGKKTYYVLEKGSDKREYIVKDTDGKYKKELKANALKFYDGGIIAARLNTQDSLVYDNIWQINNDGLGLINKNVVLTGTPSGIYDIKPIIKQGGMSKYVDGYKIVNIKSGQEVYPNPANSRSLQFYTMGAIGENIILAYIDQNGDRALGIYNGTTGKSLTLLNAKSYPGAFQMLTNGRQTLLKVFDNPNLSSDAIGNDMPNVKAKIDAKVGVAASIPGKYIDLKTLKEVTVSESELKPVLINTRGLTRVTYDLLEVWMDAYYGKIVF